MGWRDENPCDYGMEEELEREALRRAGYVPRCCRTEDEYREWLRGDVNEWELGQRRAAEAAVPVADDSRREDRAQAGEPA